MHAYQTSALRRVKLFKNNRNQAIRIPKDFEFTGKEVMIHKEGNRLIIESISQIPFAELFASWQPLSEGLSTIPDLKPDDVAL